MSLRNLAYPVGTIVLGALLVVWTLIELNNGETTALSWITLVIGAIGVLIGLWRLYQVFGAGRTDSEDSPEP